MGKVYLGRSAGGRSVAVKVIHASLAARAEFRTRFRREVEAARRVNGLYTAGVVDADVDGPVPWLATVYVDGPSLAEVVATSGPLSLPALLALAAGLAEALTAIHDAGVVHRDLKPSNVLISPDGPRVIDFGISHPLNATTLTIAGTVLGTPGFMSPEQAQGQDIGPASDVFSLGGVLAFAATGRAPFGDGPLPALAYRVVYVEADLDGVPDEVRPLLECCLAKSPGARPAPAQVLAEIGGRESGLPGSAPSARQALRQPGIPGREPAWAMAGPAGPERGTGTVLRPGRSRGQRPGGRTSEPLAGAPQAAAPTSASRRWRARLTVATAVLLAAAGAGIAFALRAGSPPAPGPDAVNTCARPSSGPALPTEVRSLPVGRPGAQKDFTGATPAPGCQVFALVGNGTVQVWNMATGHQLSTLPANAGSWAFATPFTPDGKTLAVAALNGSTTLWTVDSGQLRAILHSDPATASTTAGTWGAAVSPDGSRLYTGGATNIAREWDLATRKTVLTIAVPDGIGSLALSPDGKTLAIGGGKGTEYLFNATTGQEITSLPGHMGNAFSITFSPDGKLLAAATQSGGLQLWDIATRTLVAHDTSSGGATDVAFSPDDAILAVGYGNSVGLWNVATRHEITTVTVGTGQDFVTGMAFSRYGAVLAIGYDGAVEFWNVAGVSRLSQ